MSLHTLSLHDTLPIFKDLKEPCSDSLLLNALHLPGIVTACYQEDTAMVINHEYFRSASQARGFVNLDQPDGGRVIREFSGVQITGDTLLSFADRKSKRLNSSH